MHVCCVCPACRCAAATQLKKPTRTHPHPPAHNKTRPDDGKMKGIAFIKDPDGYWIEILSPDGMARLLA